MLLAKPHRRSTRRRSSSAYAKANKIEKRPGKLHRKQDSTEEEDEYADCPVCDGFAYDKDYYLASDKYALLIDEAIAEFKAKKDWEEAIKYYNDESKEEE